MKPSAAATRSRTGPDPKDLVRVVEAARRGDRSAFGEIYAEYRRVVRGIVMARVPIREVEDVVSGRGH